MLSANVTEIAYFGDSLTDDGSSLGFVGSFLPIAVPPDTGGYAGRFTNGPVYAEIGAARLGLQSSNLAVGGAEAVRVRTIQDFLSDNGLSPFVLPGADPSLLSFDVGLAAQVARYVSTPPANGANVAASILIGFNDYAAFTPTSAVTADDEALALMTSIIGSVVASATSLANAGVGTIILNTLPASSFIPAGVILDPATQADNDRLIDIHNAALFAASIQLQTQQNVAVEIVNFAALAREVARDQEAYGFAAPLDATRLQGSGIPDISIGFTGLSVSYQSNPASAGFDDDQIAFWDSVHPSAALHGIFGAFYAASLGPESVSFLGTGPQAQISATGIADLWFAESGRDMMHLGVAADTGFGGTGDDRVFGHTGHDLLQGGDGDDAIFGGRGRDVVAGGIGDDIVFAERGADVLIDGLGSDRYMGGLGDDVFLFTEASLIGGAAGDLDIMDGEGGFDTLYLVLTDASRNAVQAAVNGGDFSALAAIGLTVTDIESVQFLNDRSEFATLSVTARLGDADIWNMI